MTTQLESKIIIANEIAQAIASGRANVRIDQNSCKCCTRVYLGFFGMSTKQVNQLKKAMELSGYRYMSHSKSFYIGYDNASGIEYYKAVAISLELDKLGLHTLVEDVMD